MEDGILVMIDEILNNVAEVYMTKTWSYMPETVKKEAVISAHRACPEFLTAFVLDMQNNIEEILDIKEMCVSACVKNKEIVNQIFQECGEKEFIFIRRSGFYFGFLFGCIQMGLWFAYSGSWLLPVCGFVVGWFTNFLALKVIFRPLKPKKVGPIVVQGIFLKRQKEGGQYLPGPIPVDLDLYWDGLVSLWGYAPVGLSDDRSIDHSVS